MITRIWHGWTTPDNADAYSDLLHTEVLPSIKARRIAGYHGAHLLRRDLGEEIEFITMLWFDSLADVRAMAGDDYETAYVPPRARELLSRFDKRSQHYELLLKPSDL